METGANKGQAGFILTALDGKQDLPPGDHPLWIFDEGNAVRWIVVALIRARSIWNCSSSRTLLVAAMKK